MNHEPDRYSLEQYTDENAQPKVARFRARAQFSPLDINIVYLSRLGWNQAVDRCRFHTQTPQSDQPAHPLAKMMRTLSQGLTIRQLDAEEDRLVALNATPTGEVTILSNDLEYAREFFSGCFLDCPPAFHHSDEFDIETEWVADEEVRAYFMGMLTGARGWDPSHSIPDNIGHSLREARRSLEIANYKSTVVMARRTMEAVIKFAFRRLLKKEPVNNKGRGLMLNDMIMAFRNDAARPIPDHLLHIADSVRLIGNVPGAHATNIKDYHFTRSDAEYAFYAVSHFIEQYFSKLDTDVTTHYTVTIDQSI